MPTKTLKRQDSDWSHINTVVESVHRVICIRNMRIYGVKEGEERNDMINFITELMRTSFELPVELDLCVERAHRRRDIPATEGLF